MNYEEDNRHVLKVIRDARKSFLPGWRGQGLHKPLGGEATASASHHRGIVLKRKIETRGLDLGENAGWPRPRPLLLPAPCLPTSPPFCPPAITPLPSSAYIWHPPNIWNVGQHGWRLLQNSLVFCTDSTYTDSIFLLSNFFNNSPNHLYTAPSQTKLHLKRVDSAKSICFSCKEFWNETHCWSKHNICWEDLSSPLSQHLGIHRPDQN